MPDKPDILTKRHWDWPWPFKWVPRSWTSVQWGPPKKMWGTQARKRKPVGQEYWSPTPIGEPSSWQASGYPNGKWPGVPLYFAVSFGKDKRGWFRHFRIGLRYDDVDKYSTWSVATRKFPSSGERDTST